MGILSYQILNSMWRDPKMWLYPMFGTSIAHASPPTDYRLYLLETDLYNPAE